MIKNEATELLKRTEDLERRDQKPFPSYHPLKLAIPDKYIGDFLCIKEFLHSFSGHISGYNVFKNNITFYEITRAFLAKEVAGPLSDIILVLLGTVFDLQKDEEEECPVDYIDKMETKEGEIYETALYASHTQKFVQKYYALDLNKLPMDAQTISEVLRLHFLASGAYVKDKAEKWRVMYRNGYSNIEDPGLILRLQKPHILKALKEKTIFELPFQDVIAIINCLINQILTYSATINVMIERMETTSKAKFDLRGLVVAENKRIFGVTDEKKKLTNEFLEKCNEEEIKADETKKQALEFKLNKQIAEIMATSEREKSKFEKAVEDMRSNIFDYMVYLGLDRAHRKYYVFESLPGIFVEHSDEYAEEDGSCFENPPENIIELAEAPHNKKELLRFLKKLYTENNNLIKKSEGLDKEDDKENVQIQTTLNGGKVIKPPTEKARTTEATPENLFLCTGDRQSCLIHNKKHPKKQKWSFICEEAEVEALIDSLNPLGERESYLKQQLSSLRVLIIDHVKKCPANLLSLESEEDLDKFKIMMNHETNKKYSEANFAKDENLSVNEIMRITLLERVLKLEDDISSGNLGQLKIADVEKWRQDLYDGKYDPQTEIKPRIESEKPYSDPAINLGERKYDESTCDESSSDELNATVIGDFNGHLDKVKQLANALIQVEQGIEQRFLKEPFGSQKEIKDKAQAAEIFEAGRERLGHWEMTVLNATSYSQIFLNLNILYDAIKWRRSTKNTSCSVCRRRSDPEKLLLCDECNAGTHMFCMKPKLKVSELEYIHL